MQLAIWLAADDKLTPPPPARHIRPSQPGPEPPHADTPVPQPQGTPVRVHPVAHPVNAKWSFRCNCNTMLTSIPIKREPARHAAFAQGKITVINTVRLAAQATTMRLSGPTIGSPTIGGPKIGGRDKNGLCKTPSPQWYAAPKPSVSAQPAGYCKSANAACIRATASMIFALVVAMLKRRKLSPPTPKLGP